LEQIASKTHLKIDFGGGLKSNHDLKIAFECGAQQITGGSIAVKQPEVFESWLRDYGSSKIILGADCHKYKIAVNGWQEESDIDVISFIKEFYNKNGVYVICTDISKDGMLEGPSFELYKQILKVTPDLKLIASGGISSIDDLYHLKEIGCEGAIIGKAIYEGKIKLKEVYEFMSLL
jgi:phosphoribosylformimino-5-aminoimidazole carboxamide ribotide isomerase